MKILVLLVLLLGPLSEFASGKQPARYPGATRTQKILDILARPTPAGTSDTGLPSNYADWTEDQRRRGPLQIGGRCRVLWGMMNDAGPIRLLPEAQAAVDNQKLPAAICLAAHMPPDWPGRPAALAEVKRILTRSAELGEPLSLPASLAK